MSDEFALSIGQAHELEFAFRRTGWNAAEVKELAKGDILASFREVVRGCAEIRPRETAVSVPAAHKPLLEPIGTIVIPATTEQFIARERFVVGTGRKAKVKIAWLGGNFQKWFLDKVEAPASEMLLRYAKLMRSALDDEIRKEIGIESEETTLAAIYALMKRQKNGESGVLLTNGHANIFYVRDPNGVLHTVNVYWFVSDDVWNVYACPITDPYRWRDGDQVFSRNSLVAQT